MTEIEGGDERNPSCIGRSGEERVRTTETTLAGFIAEDDS